LLRNGWKELYAHEEAHQDWRTRLEAVAGVYLILADTAGHQYVGSAYGAAGVWGRWEQYAKTGHGENKLPEKLEQVAAGWSESPA
jgi:hypothetical protein